MSQDPPLPKSFSLLMPLDQRDFMERGPGAEEIHFAEAQFEASKGASAGERVFVPFNPNNSSQVMDAMEDLYKNQAKRSTIYSWWTSTMSEKVAGKGARTTRRDLRIKNQERIKEKQAKQHQQREDTRRRTVQASSRPAQQVAHPRQVVEIPQQELAEWDAEPTKTIYSCPWNDDKFDDVESLDRHVLAKHWDIKTNQPKTWSGVESTHQGIILKFFQDQFRSKVKAKAAKIQDQQFAGARSRYERRSSSR